MTCPRSGVKVLEVTRAKRAKRFSFAGIHLPSAKIPSRRPMKRLTILFFPLAVLATLALLESCASVSSRALAWEAKLGPVPDTPISPDALYREANVSVDLIPKGAYGRRNPLRLKPRYITIHSTQNYSGDAYAHAKALKRGKLRGGRRSGYLFWHYTVQEDVAIQHLPTNEAGEHADLDGPGNHTSIGIEMAEHRGNDIARTIDRTAKLTAWLAYTNRISVSKVVPHYHWPREGYNPAHKNCPHFLLDRGKPRGTWKWFQNRVRAHHNRIRRPRN